MAFYVVKTGGTATGDAGREATQPTGSFASRGVSNFYDNIQDVFDGTPTTAPVASDIVLVSDAHTHTYSGLALFDGPITGDYIYVVSVADANMDASSTGAAETMGAGADLTWSGWIWSQGVDYNWGDDLTPVAANSNMVLEACTVRPDAAADGIILQQDGTSLALNDVTINLDNASAGNIIIRSGCSLFITGGGYTGTTKTNAVFGSTLVSGGGTVLATGWDLSNVSGPIVDTSGATSDDLMDFRFFDCTMNSTPDYSNTSPINANHRIEFARCSGSATTVAEHQYYLENANGIGTDNTTIFRNDGDAFSLSGARPSIQVITNAGASKGLPFVFELPGQYVAFSSASTDTIEIFFAVVNTTTLTDVDVWAELYYPDGTNENVFNKLSNATVVSGTQCIDILAAGTTHTTDSSSDWRDGGGALTGFNEYVMTLDTSGDVGSDAVPWIRVYVSIPSETIYIDTAVGVVA